MKRLEFFGLSFVLCFCMAIVEVRVGALTPRIVGGGTAREGQFPYQTSLRIFDEHQCGASLISHNYVLTAGHCVQIMNSTETFLVSDLKVRAGTIHVDSGGVLVNVSQVKVHPNFRNIDGPNYDIALLKLATPLEFTNKIQPIELAEAALQPGTTIGISGWGHLSTNGSAPEILQLVNLRVSTDKKCLESYEVYLHTAFCAQKMNKGSCDGDSGGPAVYNGTLVGIQSFSAETCASEIPDGFTKIIIVRDWIIKNSDLKKNVI